MKSLINYFTEVVLSFLLNKVRSKLQKNIYDDIFS